MEKPKIIVVGTGAIGLLRGLNGLNISVEEYSDDGEIEDIPCQAAGLEDCENRHTYIPLHRKRRRGKKKAHH